MTPPGDRLRAVLERARSLGFLGPGPIGPQIAHAEGFATVIEDALDRRPRTLADLGSGGGVPGLVLAARWTSTQVTLVESMGRRADFLREAGNDLALGNVSVAHERAETLAHLADFRERFEAVTARGFAEPAVTAEIASGFVIPDGILVVSEPPELRQDRWPAAECAALGLAPAIFVETTGHFAVLRKVRPLDAGLPRGVGKPAKRPRW